LKIDKLTKDLFTRINSLSFVSGGSGNGNGRSNNTGNIRGDDDEYYLATDQENPRMTYYRYYRVNNCTDEYRKQTFECVYDWVSQDELDFRLKTKLRVSPEIRYQIKKAKWYWHESSYYNRGLDAYDGIGCNGFIGCISECRYHADDGRIEDEEVISEHRELEEEYRRQNRIVNLEIDVKDYQRFLKVWD
jgi:hypothetical protein